MAVALFDDVSTLSWESYTATMDVATKPVESTAAAGRYQPLVLGLQRAFGPGGNRCVMYRGASVGAAKWVPFSKDPLRRLGSLPVILHRGTAQILGDQRAFGGHDGSAWLQTRCRARGGGVDKGVRLSGRCAREEAVHRPAMALVRGG